MDAGNDCSEGEGEAEGILCTAKTGTSAVSTLEALSQMLPCLQNKFKDIVRYFHLQKSRKSY